MSRTGADGDPHVWCRAANGRVPENELGIRIYPIEGVRPRAAVSPAGPADDLDMSPQLLCQRCEMARSDGRETCPSCGLEFRESAFLGLPKPSVYRRLARERIAALSVG